MHVYIVEIQGMTRIKKWNGSGKVFGTTDAYGPRTDTFGTGTTMVHIVCMIERNDLGCSI